MNADFPLNSSISIIYLFLLEFWDKSGQKDFELSDTFVSIQLKISRPTINSAKKELRDLGLISYQVANGLPTFYKIITDYSPSRKTVKEKEIKKISEKQKEKSVYTEKNIAEEKTENKEIPIQEPIEKISLKPTETVQNQLINKNIPSLEEFMEYAKTLEVYNENLDFAVKSKYETWKENNWLNGYGKPITNWRQSLKNTISFLKPNSTTTQKLSIPKIVRPKNTYNE